MEEGKMESFKFNRRRKFGFALMAIVFVIAIGFVIMLLWNWLMPELFGLSTITYWQAVGLLILSKILFGGGWSKKQHPRHSHYWKKRFMSKWDDMCEEDRDKIKERFRRRNSSETKEEEPKD
jgi:hypothetical protein